MSQQQDAQTINVDGLARAEPRVQHRRFAGFLRLIKKQPVGAVAAAILLIIAFSGVFAELVSTHDPVAQVNKDKLFPPGTISPITGERYILGTDVLGRDVFSRVVYGARISLAVGFTAVIIGTVSGMLLGMLCAYRKGKLDMIVQRISDGKQAIPTLILAMLLVTVLGKSLVVTAIAIGITQIPTANRIIRSHALSVVQEPYMDAAKAMGASELRLLLQHIMPNVMATTLIVFSTSIGRAITTESTLSFLGLAASPPLVTWGGMLTTHGRQYMLVAPWLLIAPAAALSLTVLAFNFLGDSIRDVLDPRLRGR
jgi:peptide/nickel transport system permease protein